MQDLSRLVGPLALLAGAGIAAIALLLLFMRLSRARRSAGSAAPFTLADLRDMQARGDISQREFQALREQVLQMSRATPRGAAPDRPRAERGKDAREEQDH